MDKPGSLHRPQRRVLLLGYSGMVGSALLEQCIRSDQVYEILCLGRKEPAFTHFKMRWIASDLLQPGQDAPHYVAIDRVFCALGTTLRQAGSVEAFRQVDYQMVVNAAALASQCQVPYFGLVSSVGANPQSLLPYARTKGECEEALRRMQFQRLSIFRPGLLLGQRTASRPAEALARWTYPLWDWALPRSAASVHAQTVACAMLLDSLKEDQGEDIFDSQQIKILAKLLPR
ncbi:MAG: NAD-dependent epimerase/dehydratase family protein [Bacteroidetes bacterium]|nr:NAD-dependent epimerase/dehydratase family protein [Bacteroidota bacterium]